MKTSVYKVMIVDDEPLGIENLCNSLKKYDNITIVATSQQPKSVGDLLLEKKPDLLFIDIEMPEITGIQLLKELQHVISWPMHVVFYTAYEKYLLEALRISAFDYLLKPYNEDDLSLVINRFYEATVQNQSFEASLNRLENGKRMIMVATVFGYKVLNIDNIAYFEYCTIDRQRRWFVYLTDSKKPLTLKSTITATEIENFSERFCQIASNTVINISYLSMIKGRNCFLFPPYDNKMDLIISRGYFKNLQNKFDIL